MKSVFILWHTHKLGDESDDEKLIGVYGTDEKAKAAIRKLSKKPGFKDTVDVFEVIEYVLDKDHWTDGFVSGSEASL